MTKAEIEKPKVFISYAWGSPDYQAKVLSLAKDLTDIGIEVIIDKCSLKEGHDTYAFMEQCVTDPSITNVLILLDETYAKKADSRSGGVGTETQIISPEIYSKVDQEKFIPVVFERDSNGDIHKPAFLKTLLHFDLTSDVIYDDEYKRLVWRLYGKEVYALPKLGKKPSWVDSPPQVSTKARNAYGKLDANVTNESRVTLFVLYLKELKEELIRFKENDDDLNLSPNEYLSVYEDMKSIRDEFLYLIKRSSGISNAGRYISMMLEETFNSVNIDKVTFKDLKLTLLHEIFIYSIAYLLKSYNYEELGYLLGKTYFIDSKYDARDSARNFRMFYHHSNDLDKAMNDRDEKNYLSGTAQYWIENIESETCSKNDFVLADELCFNYSIYGKDYHEHAPWFPKTYVYGGYDNSAFRKFAVKFQSTEFLAEASMIFGYSEIPELSAKVHEVEQEYRENHFREVRYNSAFESAPFISQFIKHKDLGTRR